MFEAVLHQNFYRVHLYQTYTFYRFFVGTAVRGDRTQFFVARPLRGPR